MKTTYKQIADRARLTGRAPVPAITYFPKDGFIDTLRKSHNYSDACFNLGLSINKTSNQRALQHLRRIADFHDITIRHYLVKNGRTYDRENPNPKTPTEEEMAREILVFDGRRTESKTIKKWIWFYGLKKKKCEECGIGMEYNDKPIMLELHHVNGINIDNRLENLQILCPNCHSQTPNYKARNIR